MESDPASDPAAQRSAWNVFAAPLLSLALVLIATGMARLVLGPTLGLLFFIPIATCAARLAYASCRRRHTFYSERQAWYWLRRGVYDHLSTTVTLPPLALDLIAALIGVAAAIGMGSPSQLVQLFVVTAALTAAFSAGARVLIVARVPSAMARTFAMLLLLAWLTLPVWLSPYWSSGPLLDRLLDAHPLLAINSIYDELGDWTHSPLAYNRLTNLNQDVPFALPASIGWCVGIHAVLSIALIAVEMMIHRIRRPATATLPIA